MPQRRFRYTWFRTWDDKPEDYACTDGEVKVGRVYRINSISTGGWFWTMNGRVGNLSGASHGRCNPAMKPAMRWKAHYDELKARVGRSP